MSEYNGTSWPQEFSKVLNKDWKDESLPSWESIHQGWYTDPTLPEPWSTDWDYWDGIRLFRHKVDGKLKIDKLFKDVFDVPGTVEPVAYHVGAGDEFFLFTANGRYYFYSDGTLTVHRMEFESPKEFLEYALHEDGHQMPDVEIRMRPGADLEWW